MEKAPVFELTYFVWKKEDRGHTHAVKTFTVFGKTVEEGMEKLGKAMDMNAYEAILNRAREVPEE